MEDDEEGGVGGANDLRFSAGSLKRATEAGRGIAINIIQGDICDEQVDVVVNSVAADFNLSKGAISASILNRAGPAMQQELNVLKSEKRTHGREVFVTKGYKMKARYVFHGVIKKWNVDAEDTQNLRKFIKNVLLQASDMKMNSIAFPAIGTGKLGYPANEVANCLYDTIASFSVERPSSTVSTVHIIVHSVDSSTFKVFVNMLAQRYRPPNPPSHQGMERDQKTKIPQAQVPPVKGFMQESDEGYPSYWSKDPENITDPFRMIELNPPSQEYETVRQNVLSSAGKLVTEIVKIQRIENHRAYRLFQHHAQEMIAVNGASVQNERRLWHGTARECLSNVSACGLNRGYCGKNGTRYGDGVYFATQFCYSADDTYSPRDSQTGCKYVIQCRVLTGHYTEGDKGLKEPPIRVDKLRYNSVVDDVTDPSMFAIFQDGQAYLEYLVTFK